MTNKADISIYEEARMLRKKVKRVDESRSSIKTKNSEKGKLIKLYKGRIVELTQNRDDWKANCKELESELIETNNNYKTIAAQLEMKEEELRQLLSNLEDSKKNTTRKKTRKS